MLVVQRCDRKNAFVSRTHCRDNAQPRNRRRRNAARGRERTSCCTLTGVQVEQRRVGSTELDHLKVLLVDLGLAAWK